MINRFLDTMFSTAFPDSGPLDRTVATTLKILGARLVLFLILVIFAAGLGMALGTVLSFIVKAAP